MRACPVAPGALLDVGCGYGYFLETRRSRRVGTVGVDIVPEAVSRGQPPGAVGAEVLCGDLSDAGWPAASLDAVTLWDVLCHGGGSSR